MKFSDVRRLSMDDIADEIEKILEKAPPSSDINHSPYAEICVLDDQQTRRVRDLCEELKRRSRELDRR